MPPDHTRRILTLARKFDAVHRNTVTSNRLIPRVLLAIFLIPPFRSRLGILPQDADDPGMFSDGTGGSESLLLGASNPGCLSSAVIVDSGAAISSSDKRSVAQKPFVIYESRRGVTTVA